MIFRQLFDPISSTYSYLIAQRPGGEALIIDPVKEQVPKYRQLLTELDVKLVFAIDTHIHADHITGIGDLSDQTGCLSVLGKEARAECVNRRVTEGETLRIDGLELKAIYTPGHTDDSYYLS